MDKDTPPGFEAEPASASSEDARNTYPPYTVAGERQELTLAALLAVARRRAVPMAAALAIIVAIGLFYTFSLTPRYTATATVLFDQGNQSPLDLNQLLGNQSGPPISISNQVQILTSTSFAGKVVDKLHLEADPEFGSSGPGGFGLLRYLKRLVGLGADTSASANSAAHIATVNRFLDRLTTTVQPGTSVISIGFSSEDPAKAARISNAIAENYITDQLDARYQATKTANDWLSGRLAELKKRVTDAELAVASYASAHNLQVLDQAGQTVSDQQVAQINQDLLQARSNLAEKETRYEGVQSILKHGGSVDAVPELMSSPIFQSLRSQRATLVQQKSQLSAKYGARHPEMIKLGQQIASIDEQIHAEVQRIVAALKSEVDVARSQVAVLEKSLQQAQGQNATADQASVHLRELQRNAESAKSLYEAFLKRFNELGEQSTLPTTDARVIGAATVPQAPSYPRTSLYLAGSLAAGLLAAALVAFLLEHFDRGLRTRQQVEAELGLPMLANIPLMEDEELSWEGRRHVPSEIIIKKPLSAYNEALRALRAGIQLSNPDEAPVLVLITSALPNEGKTTGALSLARSAAQSGDRVLLIDGDIRRPALEKALGRGHENGIGLIQCVRGEAQLHEAIFTDEISPLHILLPGASVHNPPDVLSSRAMRNILAGARQSYDLVIVDSSPVLPAIDSRLLSRLCDTTVFFVRWEDTPKDAAQEAVRLLASFDAQIAGAVLSMTDRKRQMRYGYYGDSYSYYGKYQNYYSS